MTPDAPGTRRAFYGLVLAFSISSVGFGVMAPFLVIWAHRDAGLTGTAAGLLFVAQALGEISGGLGGGLLADRLGARQVLLVSTVGMAASYGALAFIGAPGLAVAVIFVGGLFEAAFHPTAFALVAELKPPEERAGAYGLLRAGGNLGTILGPLSGAALVAGASIADVFLLAGALLALSGFALFAVLPSRGGRVSLEEEAEEIQAAVPGLKAVARDLRLALLVGGGGLLAITVAWWEADGLVIVQTQRGFTASTFSLMLAISAATIVVFQIPVSRITRGRSAGVLIAVGALIQGLGLAALALASGGLAWVIAAAVLIAFGETLYGPNVSALVSMIAPPGRGATYQAAVSMSADIGLAGGPASGLALSAGIGARLMWVLALPLGALAGAAGWRAARGDTASALAPEQSDEAALVDVGR
jgi:MFS family permease